MSLDPSASAVPLSSGPYCDLLVNVPALLVGCLTRAADSEAAFEWFSGGPVPDPGSPRGVHPVRRHLLAVGEEGDSRYLVWHGDRYDDDSEDSSEFTDATDIVVGPRGYSPKGMELVSFRLAVAEFLALTAQTFEQELDMEVLPGSYYAVIAVTKRSSTYHGVYRLDTRLRIHESPRPHPLQRVWLNGCAERLLSRVLSGC